MNLDVSTDGLERVNTPAMQVLPPLATPTKSPFYISQFPVSTTVSADTVKNFTTNAIPNYRISTPVPLTLSGAGVNATATPAVVPILQQPTPAPTIASSLVSNPTGYQFSFNEVRLPLGANFVISTYKIYRSTANSSATATVIDTIPHNPTQASTPVVVQDAQPNGSNFFYWISAVNSRGVESSLTAAQSGLVANTSIANANSQLASSFHNNAVNVTYTPTSATVLSNDGSGTTIIVAASTNQFGSGAVSYNSGSTNPGNFGTYTVYADDPLYQGGAVVYQSTLSPSVTTAAEGRVVFGTITTVSGSSKTGGGNTGGSTSGGGVVRPGIPEL